MKYSLENLKSAVADVPAKFRGPGGAIAVLKDGQVVAERAWGFADLDKKAPMTSETLLPICSITKQMLCATILAVARAQPGLLDVMSEELEKLHPDFVKDGSLKLSHLWNMQSGIRDYWALTVLWGAKVGGRFSIHEHGPQAQDRLGGLHFQPGSEFSYSNVNFYVLEHCLNRATGSTFAKLAKQHLFEPAAMHTAAVRPDTSNLPSPIVGYEGAPGIGFFPAPNAIEWSGDAGVVASLSDMIAYEKFLDRSYTDPDSVYKAMLERQHFSDGTPACYQYGLFRSDKDGITSFAHTGGLRGFSLHRLHIPEERLSVVVLRNSHSDPVEATNYVIKQALSIEEETIPVTEPSSDWERTYLDEETQLKVEVTSDSPGKLKIRYAGQEAETVTVVEPNRAESPSMTAQIDNNTLTVDRLYDHRRLHATAIASCTSVVAAKGFVGDYYCHEVESTFHVTGQDGMLYGTFEGFLGHGAAHPMRSLGEHVWALECPRALDRSPPGDWTLVLHRDEQDKVDRLTVGCWLARKLEFQRSESNGHS